LRLKGPLAAALAGWLAVYTVVPAAVAGDKPTTEPTDVSILQLRVLDGEGRIVGASGRSGRGITVQVTDETGRPVEGAAISFHLPSDDPSGLFLSGLKTEIVMTGTDGKAAVSGIQWNSVAGPVQIRVTAAKGEVRAGVMVTHYVSDKPVADEGPKVHGTAGGSKMRWLILALAAGAGGGAALALTRSKSTVGPGGSIVAPPAITAAPGIGTPTISVGKP
jgi:hypothetical protein